MPVSGVDKMGGTVYPQGVDRNLGSADLGVDDFLKLLTAQLQNQNMMEPASDTEFIAQMAQFSTLQQMRELSAMFQSTQALSYVGKNVIVKDVDDKGNIRYVPGVVSSVNFENQMPYLLIGENYFKLSDVTDVYTGIPSDDQTGGNSDLPEENIEII
ncbi:MAG TPA: flagellar hook capping protein [Ruminococcaceae bacterium]|jgi:flagellar basal-body rod modification protein FlgD|nr:flagellar hook capping protein [Oscillospiraceae bacterium]